MLNGSVNTNVGAMIALQNLNATNSQLQTTENRINTGLKVASAKDDGATWAIAQSQRSTVSSLDAVKDSLSRASSTIDVAMSAGESISDLLTQMKEKALAASDTSLDSTSRKALATDFNSLRDQITKTVKNAAFNGIDLLDGFGPVGGGDAERVRHEVAPDPRRDAAARQAWIGRIVVVADPHAGHHAVGEAHEQGVAIVLRRPGLAEGRDRQVRSPAGPALHRGRVEKRHPHQ